MAPRRFQRALWITSGIASLCVPPLAWAQKHDPTLMPAPASSNVGCDIAGCQPRATSYGYYRENWRRWPEEPATPSITPKLTPYATMPRPTDAPKAEVPEARDEVSNHPRHAPSAGAAPIAPSTQPSPTVTPQATPAPAAPSTSVPQTPPTTDLPDATSVEPPSEDGFSAVEETPSTDELPPSDEGLPADNEPMFPQSPAEENEDLNALPEAEPTEEDGLLEGLPDLSQDNRRLQRYQNGRVGHYRRADEDRASSQARRRPAPPKREMAASKAASRPKRSASHSVAVNPVAYRTASGRRNPLRPQAEASEQAANRTAHTSRSARIKREVVPVEFIEEEGTEEYVDTHHYADDAREESFSTTDEGQLESDVAFTDDSEENGSETSATHSSSAPAGRSNPLRDSSL